jgi:hypothetical protein
MGTSIGHCMQYDFLQIPSKQAKDLIMKSSNWDFWPLDHCRWEKAEDPELILSEPVPMELTFNDQVFALATPWTSLSTFHKTLIYCLFYSYKLHMSLPVRLELS